MEGWQWSVWLSGFDLLGAEEVAELLVKMQIPEPRLQKF